MYKNPHRGAGFKYCAHQDLPSGSFPDGKFLQAGLAVLALRLVSANQNIAPTFKSCRTPSSWCAVAAKNPHRSAGFKYCAHQDLNLEPTDYESVALTD